MLILLLCQEKPLLLTLIRIFLRVALLPSGPRGSSHPNRAGQSLPPLVAALWTIFAHRLLPDHNVMTLSRSLLSTQPTWNALFLEALLLLILVLPWMTVTLSPLTLFGTC